MPSKTNAKKKNAGLWYEVPVTVDVTMSGTARVRADDPGTAIELALERAAAGGVLLTVDDENSRRRGDFYCPDRGAVEQVGPLPLAPKAAPGPVKPFFFYGPDVGVVSVASASEARSGAASEIATYRSEAAEEWASEVGGVGWGRLVEVATEVPIAAGEGRSYVDYVLATPGPLPSEGPVPDLVDARDLARDLAATFDGRETVGTAEVLELLARYPRRGV